MNDLDKALQDFGFSNSFINSVNEAKKFDSYEIDVRIDNFQLYDNEIVSSTELEIEHEPTSCSNYLIESGG